VRPVRTEDDCKQGFNPRPRRGDKTMIHMHTTKSTPGERIRAARNAKGLSTRQAAELAGMSQPNWTRLETGKHQATVDTLVAVADALGVKPSDLDPRLV
jgi:ribosome-binding protein aMBF1 (putative translation factor)